MRKESVSLLFYYSIYVTIIFSHNYVYIKYNIFCTRFLYVLLSPSSVIVKKKSVLRKHGWNVA